MHAMMSSNESKVSESLQSSSGKEDKCVSAVSMNMSVSQHATEIVRSLFGASIGPVVGDYSCSLNHCSGRLYSGQKALCFYSNLFGFERRLSLAWADVSSVVSLRNTSVAIETLSGDTHVFKSFADRDKVLQVLLQLHGKAGQGRAVSARPVNALPAAPTRTVASRSSDVSDSESEPSQSQSQSQESVEESWEEHKLRLQQSCSDTALKPLTLPCDLDTFFALFLADDASHSIQSYQQQTQNDTDLQTTNWTPADHKSDTSSPSLTRTISFTHKISAPVGPPTTRAQKIQHYQRFTDRGITVTTYTILQDAPNADCFHVQDCWLLELLPDNTISFQVNYQVKFLKSTMWKHLIDKFTKKEVEDWYDGYRTMILNRLSPDQINTQPIIDKTEQTHFSTKSSFTINLLITTTVIFTILILIFKIRSLENTLTTVQHQLQLIQIQHRDSIRLLQQTVSELETKIHYYDQHDSCPLPPYNIRGGPYHPIQ